MYVFFYFYRLFVLVKYLYSIGKYIMDKNDVKGIVNDEIKKFVSDALDKEIKKILHNKNSASRGELITTIKDAMESVYKMLWVKKEFWKSDIK